MSIELSDKVLIKTHTFTGSRMSHTSVRTCLLGYACQPKSWLDQCDNVDGLMPVPTLISEFFSTKALLLSTPPHSAVSAFSTTFSRNHKVSQEGMSLQALSLGDVILAGVPHEMEQPATTTALEMGRVACQRKMQPMPSFKGRL